MQIIQSTPMASSQGNIQSVLNRSDHISNASSQGIGIASTQNQPQIIKTQQPNITYQIQRTQSTNIGLVSTPSAINTKLIGPAISQFSASSQSIVAPQSGITVVTGMPGSGTKSPIINAVVTKPQVVPRTQTQIRPTTAVNIVNSSVTANGTSLIQQQQLRMMGIASGMLLSHIKLY